jgi:hypothetical protein
MCMLVLAPVSASDHDARSESPCLWPAHSRWSSRFRQMSLDLQSAVCIVGKHQPNQCTADC